MLFKKTIWQRAISNGNDEKIKEIILTSLDWDKDWELYRHTINMSIVYRRDDLLKFLVEHSISKCLAFNKYAVMPSPLHHAVHYRNFYAVKVLFDYFGLSVINKRYDEDEQISWTKDCSLTLLELALVNDFSRAKDMLPDEKEIIIYLVKSGASVRNSLIGSAFKDYDIVQLLLEKGANPNYQLEPSYRSSLHRTRNEQIISLLLKNGANPNLRDKNGHTPYQVEELVGSISFANGYNCHTKPLLEAGYIEPLEKDNYKAFKQHKKLTEEEQEALNNFNPNVFDDY